MLKLCRSITTKKKENNIDFKKIFEKYTQKSVFIDFYLLNGKNENVFN